MAKVLFKRKTTDEIKDLEIQDGALIYNTDNGKTYMDFGESRIQTGGNADTMITIGGEEAPTDTDIKLWFPKNTVNTKASEVINSMNGNQTDLAPSVDAVKNYVKEIYSTDEVKTNKIWIDGKPIYRRVINSTCPSNSSTWTTISSNLNADEILSYTGYIEFSTSEHKLLANGTSQFTYFQLNKNSNELQIATKDDGFFGKPIKVIIEYTKTTD